MVSRGRCEAVLPSRNQAGHALSVEQGRLDGLQRAKDVSCLFSPSLGGGVSTLVRKGRRRGQARRDAGVVSCGKATTAVTAIAAEGG